MIQIGRINKLKAHIKTEAGMLLIDDSKNEVLLPEQYVPSNLKVNDPIEVFVYRDSDDWLVATTNKPLIELDNFGLLEAKEATNFGAFMDYGVDKDLLVPFKEQSTKIEAGKSYVVFMFLDEDTNRLIGSTKIQKFLNNEFLEIKEGEEVDLIVFEDSPLGYFVVVNNYYKGLIYHNEVFKKINVGDRLKGYVKKIKENHEVDISLQKLGFENVLSNTEFILDYLKKHQGFIKLTDNSSPEEISAMLNMSKKTFKKSIGILYRQQLINIAKDGVHLISGD